MVRAILERRFQIHTTWGNDTPVYAINCSASAGCFDLCLVLLLRIQWYIRDQKPQKQSLCRTMLSCLLTNICCQITGKWPIILCGIACFIGLCTEQLSAQEQLNSADTIYTGDTIIHERTIEKVVYVYGLSENYWSAGLYSNYALQWLAPQPTVDSKNYSYVAGAVIQKNKNGWLFDVGIGLQYGQRQFRNTYQSVSLEQKINQTIDTISHYEMVTGNTFETRYITRERTYNTQDTIYSDSTVGYSNTYRYLEIPLLIGKQLRYGFLCADVKAGFTPSVLLQTGKSNTIQTANPESRNEQPYLHTFTCNFSARLALRYMLTFNSIVGIEAFCNVGLLPLYKNSAPYSPRSYSLGMQLSYSFILFDKE